MALALAAVGHSLHGSIEAQTSGGREGTIREQSRGTGHALLGAGPGLSKHPRTRIAHLSLRHQPLSHPPLPEAQEEPVVYFTTRPSGLEECDIPRLPAGYVGLGFSSGSASMLNSDVVFGWIDGSGTQMVSARPPSFDGLGSCTEAARWSRDLPMPSCRWSAREESCAFA